MKKLLKSSISLLLCALMACFPLLTGCQDQSADADNDDKPGQSANVTASDSGTQGDTTPGDTTPGDTTPAVSPTGVKLSQTSLTVTVGSTATLTITVEPSDAADKSVSWTSSNPEIATASDGVITAKAVGTAVIIATTSNGKTAVCTVTVEDDEANSGLEFALVNEDSFYAVVGYYGKAKSFVIPSIHDGLRVIGIAAGAFKDNTNLREITIPTSIESIGASAFQGCTSLASITVPASVTKIEASTFSGCTALRSFSVHSAITHIGDEAFSGCTGLESVELVNGITSIGKFAFDNCTALKSITLPDSVKNVGNGAFRHADALKTVTLSKGMTKINNITFQYCKSLGSVVLHDNIKEIGNSAFSYCYGLKKLEIAGDISNFGDSSFYHCENLAEIIFSSSVRTSSLGNKHYIFCRAGVGGAGITLRLSSDAYVPEGLFEPFEKANRPKITSIIFADGTEKVDYFSLYSSFTYLKSVTIPMSVKYVSSKAFFGCGSLTVNMSDTRYVCNGWYDNAGYSGGKVNLTNYSGSSSCLYPKWTTNSDNVILTRNNTKAGSVSGGGSHPYGSSVTVKATTNTGYTFLGWYKGGTKVSSSASYTFTVPSDNVTLEARWQVNSYTVTLNKNISEAGGVSGGGTYNYGSSVTVKATTYAGYTFLGWYNGSTKVSSSTSYTFTVPAKNTTLEARWQIIEGLSDFYFTSTNGSITITGVKDKTKTSYTIPNCVTSIGSSAFRYCTSLVSITIPDSVTSIGSYAFSDCSSLKYNTYDNGKYLGNSRNPYLYLADTTSDTITSCTIHLDTKFIGMSAFSDCSSLVRITIPDSVKSIGSSAFYGCSSLVSITIPDSVTSIGGYAFYGCSSLTRVTIPDSVTSIGERAFEDCSLKYNTYDNGKYLGNSRNPYLYLADTTSNTITSCTIHLDTKFIGYYAFGNCTSLTSVTIPDSVTSIGDYAFKNCTSLVSITIPDGVTSIGYMAFYNCTSLTSITIPDSVTSIGDCAFSGCSSLKYNTYDNGKYLGNSRNPYLYLADTTSDTITSCTIHLDTKFIGRSAFDSCKSLVSITIPDSVTSIGYYAFARCTSLTSVTIGKGVTSIGKDAFYNCSSLESITIPDSVTSIGSSAFSGCTSLESITIPDSVTSIDLHAFENCTSLTSITIPDSVTSIDFDAFENCSSLKSIYYGGTRAEWNSIEKGRDWNYNTGSYTVYCKDGNIKK